MSHPLWNQLAERAGLSVSDDQSAKLSKYLDLLLAANEKMNLTRIDSREAAEVGHVGDALTLLPYLPKEAHRLADVGSGGGVPGIPLAIMRPDAKITLIESTQKKAAFLLAAATELGLSNVKISSERAEDIGHSPARETFDVVIARAVGAMVFLAEWCLPLVKKGGKMLAMKGPRIAEELPQAIRAIRFLGGGEPVIHPAGVSSELKHVIVEIIKVKRTDNHYPRPATQAKGRPMP